MKIEDGQLNILCILSILIRFKIFEVYDWQLPANAFNPRVNIV